MTIDYFQNYSISDQIKVWNIVFNTSISFDKSYTSPFRPDANPGCYFTEYNGLIMFIDWGNTLYSYITCIKAISLLCNITYAEAYVRVHKFIDMNYPLDLNYDFKQINLKTGQFKPFVNNNNKYKFTLFKNKDNDFTYSKAFIDYWKKRSIDISDFKLAINCNIYDIHSFMINGYFIKPVEYPAMLYKFNNNRFKYYCPKGNGKSKFFGTQTEKDVWIFKQDENNFTKSAILTKAFKDGLELCKFSKLDTYALHKEIIFKEKNIDNYRFIESLFKNYDKVYLFNDSDKAGVLSVRVLNSLDINLIPKFFNPLYGKDPDEVLVNNKEYFLDFIKRELI